MHTRVPPHPFVDTLGLAEQQLVKLIRDERPQAPAFRESDPRNQSCWGEKPPVDRQLSLELGDVM